MSETINNYTMDGMYDVPVAPDLTYKGYVNSLGYTEGKEYNRRMRWLNNKEWDAIRSQEAKDFISAYDSWVSSETAKFEAAKENYYNWYNSPKQAMARSIFGGNNPFYMDNSGSSTAVANQGTSPKDLRPDYMARTQLGADMAMRGVDAFNNTLQSAENTAKDIIGMSLTHSQIEAQNLDNGIKRVTKQREQEKLKQDKIDTLHKSTKKDREILGLHYDQDTYSNRVSKERFSMIAARLSNELQEGKITEQQYLNMLLDMQVREEDYLLGGDSVDPNSVYASLHAGEVALQSAQTNKAKQEALESQVRTQGARIQNALYKIDLKVRQAVEPDLIEIEQQLRAGQLTLEQAKTKMKQKHPKLYAAGELLGGMFNSYFNAVAAVGKVAAAVYK